jgi:hypothetical protein
MRNTMRSPPATGTELMRTSTSPSPTRIDARPSWGSRRSAMSIFPMTLTRETMASWARFGHRLHVVEHAVDAHATCRRSP